MGDAALAPLSALPGLCGALSPLQGPSSPPVQLCPLGAVTPKSGEGAVGVAGENAPPQKNPTRHERHARILPPRKPCSKCACNSTASRAGSGAGGGGWRGSTPKAPGAAPAGEPGARGKTVLERSSLASPARHRSSAPHRPNASLAGRKECCDLMLIFYLPTFIPPGRAPRTQARPFPGWEEVAKQTNELFLGNEEIF